MEKIYIVIIHFGDLRVTRNCISSLEKSKEKYKEIILINNDKFSISLQDLPFRRLKIFNNKENLGYAKGVNMGIKFALKKGADFILLLNNDTIIINRFINKLVVLMNKDRNIGIIGPAIEFEKNGKKIYDIGGMINNWIGRTNHKEVELRKEYMPRIVDYISGAAMLVRKEVFEKVGRFDENFFLYYEDVDFCIRSKKMGFNTVVVPEVAVNHLLSKSVGKITPFAIYHQTRSAILFGKKYFKSPFKLLLNRSFIIFQTILISLKNPKSGLSGWKAILLQY